MATQWNIRIAPSGAGRVLHGAGLVLSAGDYSVNPKLILERMESPGVDGVRFREVARRFPLMSIETYESFASQAAALRAIDAAAELKGPPVRVTVKFGDAMIEYRNARVTEIRGMLDGRLAGFGGGATSVCSVRYAIALQKMVEAG